MARLGVDFGTTNTIAVIHDRGIFSEALHATETGVGKVVQAVFPSTILIDTAAGEVCFGIEADRRFGQLTPGDHHIFVPSIKRRLRDYSEGRSAGGIGDAETDSQRSFDLANLLRGYLSALAASIRRSQAWADDEPLEVVITWPANANGAQRHITRRCFRDAGFDVVDTLNEPTASAIELADCLTAGRGGGSARREPGAVAVFDLGGGTFDASVVWVDDDDFHVLASGGIEDLGGDDFDEVLLGMFLDALGQSDAAIGSLTRHALLRQARAQKEAICGGSIRSLFLNPRDYGLDGRPLSISVDAYMDRLRPMIRPAIDMLGNIIEAAGREEPRMATGSAMTIYLVGGSSKLPLVAEMVSEAFPENRVVLSDKPFRSVAMGAAICSTEQVRVREVFARHFGLIRLKDHGRTECFDTIFPAGTAIPRRGESPIEKAAWYHPHHNLGHLRYLECTAINSQGLPAGNVRAWSDILFPYDPSISMAADVGASEILPTDQFVDEAVCEVYRCDSDGVITVELRRPVGQQARTYEVFRY